MKKGGQIEHRVKFHNPTFEKISTEKRQKIFSVAITEFAKNGYNATNINVIAKKAGISIGSIYNYFDSKEDLFLTIANRGFRLLEKALNEVSSEEGDIFDFLERLFRAAWSYALNYTEMNQIYLDCTTQALSKLSSRLSHTLESISANLYRSVIRKAKEDGLIGPDIDEKLISFCFDNLIVMFQLSFSSDYLKERMKIFLGPEALENPEKTIEGLVAFVKKALIKEGNN